jgi:uncharacterized protein YbdZ (MbtH family)
MAMQDEPDNRLYKVVVNQEEQYSIWPADREDAPGWRDDGKKGTKQECLDHIKEVWVDMRPLSLRKKMEEFAKNPPPPVSARAQHQRRHDLVDRLCEGDHPVEAGLRPERTPKTFKEAIDRNYIHIRFTGTKGGTELGFRLDRECSNLSEADFEKATGNVHVEGNLTLDYVKVRCLADIDLKTLEGMGHLVKLQATEASVA